MSKKTKKAKQGDPVDTGMVEAAYALILAADASPLGFPAMGEQAVLLSQKVQDLRGILGVEVPIFPEPTIAQAPGYEHQLFDECYELAYTYATQLRNKE